MKSTEKLILQIDNLPSIVTTFSKLPVEFIHIAEKLERDGNAYGAALDVFVDENSGREYCITINYIDKVVGPKQKRTLFGMDEDVLLAKQYK